jgi:hypothetical protein
MNETCDRCGPGVVAMYHVYRERELFLCGHCLNRFREALYSKGWDIWPIGNHALRPPVRVPSQHTSR